MLRLLPLLLMLGLTLFALIDCLARDEEDIRALPKLAWVLVILLFPPLGPVAWFIAGRPRNAAARPGSGRERPFGIGSGGAPRGRSRPVAPDDDPEFLRGLDERRRRSEDEEHDR